MRTHHRTNHRTNHHGLGTDLVLGGLAGAAATWVMGRTTGYLYEHEDRTARKREDAAHGGETADEAAARRVAAVAGRQLSDEARARAALAIPWAIGMGAGALYGALRPRVRAAGAAHGLGFGTAMWLVMDEGANVALGLTAGPAAFPWQTHARGLVGHLTFGVALDSGLRLSDRVA